MTTPSTSEVLNKAADLIEERGWATGSSAWGSHENSPLCLEGGIIAALGVVVPNLQEGAPGDAVNESTFRACPAYRAVHDYLVSTKDIEENKELWEFNDASAAERVIGVLRATALIEAAQERESVEV